MTELEYSWTILRDYSPSSRAYGIIPCSYPPEAGVEKTQHLGRVKTVKLKLKNEFNPPDAQQRKNRTQPLASMPTQPAALYWDPESQRQMIREGGWTDVLVDGCVNSGRVLIWSPGV